MKRQDRVCIILDLVKALKNNGSWCGETHVQKATYFLQVLARVPLDYDFILYKHGPFSFDLRDELTAMRADELLGRQSFYPFGSSLSVSEAGEHICSFRSDTVKKYRDKVNCVAETLGGKGVVDLERLATALYVTQEMIESSNDERARYIHRIKPHISELQALKDLDEIFKLKM
jgi:hypothetical protein